ncbi:hypothetical protein AVEN_29504-1 [Araneus ventricosus]|uniref:Tc1-like transposase DDE domain-containing protein n=1 Tax=Araneus ventricosus TaxID=182803 RepID=A0A4Y2K498_ARAVE|nr:hypothetical protein AVEN_29504-1 [Araneus ventricosus]
MVQLRTLVVANRKVETGATLDIPQFPEVVIFQQDGAPPHYGNIVREFLDTTFPQRWISRGAVMAWPPRSPDITPLDFYLWG